MGAAYHITLAGVISEQAVHEDGLLPVRKPAFLPTEPILGLARARRHQAPGEDADNKGEDALDEEEPLPTTPSVDAAHLQYACCEQGPDDVDCAESGPLDCTLSV